MNDPRSRRAVIYTRVSRDDSGEGRSNSRQEQDCRAFAELRGYEIVGVEPDISVSAYSGKVRPAWQRVLDMVRSGDADVILAWKVDRITRTVRELSDIIHLCRQTGASVVTVDGELDLSTAQGKAMATILGSISEMEVERKGERQKSANAQRRAEGMPWRSGWASFGYTRDKVVVPEQAAMMRDAARDVLAGASLKSIARAWRDSGVSTPRSSKGAQGWTHNGIKSILLNPVNAGINTYRGEEIGRGTWEPILDEGTLRQLQALLNHPSRRTYAGNGRRPENLLSGIATCARCGSTVVAGVSNGRPVYKCSGKQGEHLSTLRQSSEEFVISALTSHEVFANMAVLPRPAEHANEAQLLAELSALDRREALITERFSMGTISEETWLRGIDAIGASRLGLTEKLALWGGDQRTQMALARAAVSNFLSLRLDEKRATIAAIASIELHPRERRRNLSVEKQVSVWAKDDRRMNPLIAGSHPDSLSRAEKMLHERENASIAQLGPDFKHES